MIFLFFLGINKTKTMNKYTNELLNKAYNLAKLRVKTHNANNGYAYISCVVLDKKKSYYVLQSWHKSL